MKRCYFSHTYWDSRILKSRTCVDPESLLLTEYYDRSGYLIFERWHTDVGPHRIGAPAEISYERTNGKLWVRRQNWWQNGQIHRTDGPARLNYHENGQMHIESWLQNDCIHRIEGPAETWYTTAGAVEHRYWYIYGFQLDQERHHELSALSSKDLIQKLALHLLKEWQELRMWNDKFVELISKDHPELASSIRASKELSR